MQSCTISSSYKMFQCRHRLNLSHGGVNMTLNRGQVCIFLIGLLAQSSCIVTSTCGAGARAGDIIYLLMKCLI